MLEDKITVETREQTMAKILFFLDLLSDEQLRIAKGFVRGLSSDKWEVSDSDTAE